MPKKLSCSQAQLGQATGLAVAYFLSHILSAILCPQAVQSYYKRFNTGKGEIQPCIGCDQLPFQATLLVVTRYELLADRTVPPLCTNSIRIHKRLALGLVLCVVCSVGIDIGEQILKFCA